jgi:hypothetical protein
VVVVDVQPSRATRAQWAAYENVGLRATNELDELVLNWVDRRIYDLDVYGALVGVAIEATIEGAPSLTLTLRDPNMRILSERLGRLHDAPPRRKGVDPVAVDEGWEPLVAPSLVGRAIDVTLDGVTFRLAGLRYSTATGEAELTFEHRLIYWLRRKRGARRASRSAVTRAQFVLALLRELRARRYRFVCPELNERQPVQAVRERGLRDALGVRAVSGSSVDSSSSTRASGFAPGASITVQGKAATAEQRRNLETALARADTDSAPPRARKALVLGMIEESACVNLSGGDADSSGILQVRASTARTISGLNPRDVDAVVHQFLTNGFWKHRPRGAIELARKHPEWSPAQITQACQGSSPDRYAKWDRDADGILKAWAGSGAEAGAARGTYVKSYQFARNADEDSWTAIQRLATEVGWRAFVVGNSLYYMSEAALYARRPRYEIGPEDPAILDLSYSLDWGRPVSEATLSVLLERWDAPPGSVVVIDGYGPPDGRWLVSSVRRDYFAPVGDVVLKQPGAALMEPAPETSSIDSGSSSGGEGKSSRLYSEARRISDAGGPYVYGGGHGPALRSLQSGSGLDCSSSTSLALYRAGMFADSVAWTSGKFASSYGRPGRGDRVTVWANGGHVWIELSGLGSAKRFDTSPHGDASGRGPRLRSTERPTSGFVARHWPGT